MSKKGENIYKRKDNRWEARYIKSYHPDGTPKYGYCYGKTYQEARKKLTEAKAALLAGKPTPSNFNKRRFSFYCDEWLRLNRNRVKESTYVKYSTMLEKHIKPKLGGFLVQALSSVVIEEFSNELLYGKELSPKTVKDILSMLNSVLKHTIKHFPEPMKMIEIIYPKVPKNEIRVLSKEEQTKFVKFLLEDMDECKFGVLLALLTGIRIGEVCALRWEDISLTEQTIKIKSTMQRIRTSDKNSTNKTKIIISQPKSETSTRIIPLTDFAIELCKARHCKNPLSFVLTGRTDRYIEPRLMQYRLEQYTEACELENVHFHTLRHTFATRCVEVDFEIKSLSEILGHSSPRITLERYVHSSMELKRDNMNKLTAIGF